MEFSRQEYWSRLPLHSQGRLPNPGIEPTSPALAGGFFISEPSGKPLVNYTTIFKKSYQEERENGLGKIILKGHQQSVIKIHSK